MKIECKHVKYGLTTALSTIRPGEGPYSILLGEEDIEVGGPYPPLYALITPVLSSIADTF